MRRFLILGGDPTQLCLSHILERKADPAGYLLTVKYPAKNKGF